MLFILVFFEDGRVFNVARLRTMVRHCELCAIGIWGIAEGKQGHMTPRVGTWPRCLKMKDWTEDAAKS